MKFYMVTSIFPWMNGITPQWKPLGLVVTCGKYFCIQINLLGIFLFSFLEVGLIYFHVLFILLSIGIKIFYLYLYYFFKPLYWGVIDMQKNACLMNIYDWKSLEINIPLWNNQHNQSHKHIHQLQKFLLEHFLKFMFVFDKSA